MDITDGRAFDWNRFMANTMEHHEIAAMDLEKVFALREEHAGPTKLAFCTKGTGWSVMAPTQKEYRNTRQPALRHVAADWRTEPLFNSYKFLQGTSWMRIG